MDSILNRLMSRLMSDNGNTGILLEINETSYNKLRSEEIHLLIPRRKHIKVLIIILDYSYIRIVIELEIMIKDAKLTCMTLRLSS
jgi:hypothetical protein